MANKVGIHVWVWHSTWRSEYLNDLINQRMVMLNLLNIDHGVQTNILYTLLFLKLVFRTYSKVEILPGPGLNVVVGANGTGKSTIVCGICLGLGGKPSILGRASSVTEYIKHGRQTAVIETEL